MADQKLSQLTAEVSELGATDRLYVYDPEGSVAAERSAYITGASLKGSVRQFLTGSGVPAASFGRDGDHYRDAASTSDATNR